MSWSSGALRNELGVQFPGVQMSVRESARDVFEVIAANPSDQAGLDSALAALLQLPGPSAVRDQIIVAAKRGEGPPFSAVVRSAMARAIVALESGATPDSGDMSIIRSAR